MLHRIKVRSRVITIVSAPDIVVDGIQSDSLEVDLDAEWSAYDSVKVIFCAGLDDADPIELEWTELPMVIPWEKLTAQADLYVSVCGYIGGVQRAITRLMVMPFHVVQRGAIEGVSAQDPTVDAYELAYERVLQATAAADAAEAERATAETAREDAEAARVTAESGRVAAEEQRVSAEQARADAEIGRVNAEANRVTESADAVQDARRAAWAAWDAASRAGWYLDGHTLYLGATAYIEQDTIVLGR